MRNLYLVMAVLAAVPGCQSTAPDAGPGPSTTQNQSLPTEGSPRMAVLHVEGMSCPLCANNIDKQLLSIRGVENVSVNLGTGEVKTTLSATNPPSREALVRAIERSGFTLSRIDMPEDVRGGTP